MALMDWGGGDYERTAATLVDAARRAADTAEIAPGMRVLDLGCGTGNAAIEAARRGAEVVAVDPSARLLGVCRARADREGLEVTTLSGDAARIPSADDAFDAVLSVFAVIFAPDAELAASEMLRVVRPGGRIVVTSWMPVGPISRAGALLRDAMARIQPSPAAAPPPFAWGDPSAVREMFQRLGAHVGIEQATMTFDAASPAAWFEEQERHHPIWRGVREALNAFPGEWDRLRTRSIAYLEEGNEDPTALRVTSPYLVITARLTER
jgi:SAM-dependent methyltransferase